MTLTPTSLLRGLTVLMVAAALTACGGGSSFSDDHDGDDDDGVSTSSSSATGTTTTGTATTADTASIARGKSLYANHCAACHGSNMNAARNASQTLSAISANRGGMGSLASVIGSVQANDIATYLTYGL
jgi:mono/diheme cytochrome c family protein